MTNVGKKKKRRLRKQVKYALVGIAAIVLLLLVFTVFSPLSQRRKITALGYSKDSAKRIQELKITKTVLEKDYSSALDTNLSRGIDVTKHFDLYYVSTDVNDDIVLLNDVLQKKGYAESDLLKGFAVLKFKEMTPLLVFNNVTSMDDYIQDVLSHRAIMNTFVSGTYTKFYEGAVEVADPSATDVLLNKYSLVPSTYVPQLVELSRQYASEDQYLREEVYDAFREMSTALRDSGVEGIKGVYITSAYRSYDTQQSIYNRYLNSKGEEYADTYSARPGSSEHQLGLSFDVTATNKEKLDFAETEEYAWLVENCYKYGFILRYPEGAEAITGYSFESWHYRYVGTELAIRIHNSGLTFDEYYELYLRDYSAN